MPYGLQEWYLGDKEKNSKLKELYKEFAIYINSNKLFVGSGEKKLFAQRVKAFLTE